MNKFILLTFVASSLLNQLVYADLNSANNALARGDYAAASAEFQRLAKDGDAAAQAHLGYMYYAGEGLSQDYSEAVKWYRRAAVQGNKGAQYNLAVAYAFGEGVDQDYRESAIWYRRAAEQGHVIAQYSLGISYSYGEGVKQDSTEAVKWFQLSADQGYARSQVQLASKYHTGDGVALNYEEAVKWYRKAADKGDAAAQYNLGSMYRSGKGLPQDYNQSVRWYRLAADQGYAAATNELASLERAIAGASRAKSKPNLQPTPALELKTTKAIEEAPAREPLVSVEKSDLLTLDKEEKDVEEAVVIEAEPMSEALEDTYDEEVASEKEPGRVSGFFKKFFKKGGSPAETEMAEPAITEMAEPENIEEMQEATVAVEDLSEPIEDAETADEMVVEREVISNDASEKKSRFGFFKKLFNKKESTDEVSAEDRSVDDIDTESGVETASNSVAVAAYDTETNSSDLETTVEEEVAEVETAATDNMDAMEDEVEPEKKGFFKRLFSKKDDTATTEIIDAESEPLVADTIAMVDERSDNIPVMEEDVSIDSSAEENAAIDALEVDEKPKKKGFFKRLFSKEEQASTEAAEMESDDLATETSAMVDDDTDNVAIIDEDVSIDSSVEEDTTMAVLESDEKPKKKSFFKRLFSKEEEQASTEAAEMESDAMATETIAMVDDDTDNVAVMDEDVTIDSSAEEDAAMDALEGDEKAKKKGFFGRLFGKSDEQTGENGPDSEEIAENDETESAEYSSKTTFTAEAKDLEAAQQLLDNADYNAAYDTFYGLANNGDATAQYQVGLLYYQGLGIGQNYDEASHWYHLAAAQGNADAQYSLGNMFLMGEGVSQDDAKAIAWYERAADQGHVAAKHNVNNLKRVTSTKSASIEEMDSALEDEQLDSTVADADETIEDKPKKGFFKSLFSKEDEADELVEEETTTAVQGPLPEIQSGAEAEQAEEVSEVEDVKEKKKGFFGRLFGKDDEEEMEAATAENAEEPQPMENSASIDAISEPEQSFEDALTAVKEYEKGLAYSFGDGVAQDNNAAFDAFLRSAELGHTPAQYKTGVAYAYGEGVEKNPEQAVYWYKKAAEKGYALAQRNLGVLYMNGDGIEQNKPLAFAWHSILADGGNVMDIHRRDSLQQQLSETELEEALAIKASLKH
jgi:TPR repeat protein